MISKHMYDRVQHMELVWWTNNEYDPQMSWEHYDGHFLPYIVPFGVIADVGCGPYPYIFSPHISYGVGWAIDPLIFQYQKIPRYVELWKDKQLSCATDTIAIEDGNFDALFMLNVLDHVQSPALTLVELHRVLAPGGRFFLMVDVNRLPDPMHPHKIDCRWLLEWLVKRFRVLHFRTEESWKWVGDVFYFVGDKKGISQ